VMTLNVVLSVMTGFEEDLRDRILSFTPQITVLTQRDAISDYAAVVAGVRAVPGVVAAAPFVSGQVMLATAENVTGATVRGIPADAGGVLDLQRLLKDGSVEALGTLHPAAREDAKDERVELPGIIIGRDIGRQLGLLVGDPVSVISPMAMPTAVGMVPRVKRFVVVGVFDSGMAEYDASLVYVDLASAQRFFDMPGAVSGIEVRADELYDAQRVGARLRAALGFPYRVQDWMDANRSLFSALRLEKTVYFIVLLLIVLVAAFNIVATLIMVVMEKRKDIAILKSIGASRASIGRIFIYKGMVVGGAGTVVGVFYTNTLPVKMYPEYFVAVTLASVLICLLAAIYPARQAARLAPVDVIRYE